MNKTLKIAIICIIVALVTGTTAFAAVHFSNALKEETIESTTMTTTETTTEKDYLTAQQSDFDLFESMLNKTCWIWQNNDSLDVSEITLSELIENFVIIDAVPCGMYTNFWDIPEDYYENCYKQTFTDQDGEFERCYYELNADNVDWVIENVFGLTPDRNQSSDNYFYSGDYLYRTFDLGGGLENIYEVKATKELGNGQYGFTVFTHENIDDWSRKNAKNLYFIATLKDDNSIGHYWQIIKFSDNPEIIGEKVSDESQRYKAYLNKINEIYNKIIDENQDDPLVAEFCPTYAIYDIDNDGTMELIINTGTCEADISYEIYTYDKELINLGSVDGGHSCLAIPEDNNGLYLKYGYMDVSNLYRLTLENGKIIKKTIYENKNYDYASNYKSTVLEELHASDLSGLDVLSER